MNIAVIGGGASGIMAAITAARLGAYVTIYEKYDRIGNKEWGNYKGIYE